MADQITCALKWQCDRLPTCYGRHPQRQDELLIQPSLVRAIRGFIAITDRLHQRKQATGHSNFISVPIARTCSLIFGRSDIVKRSSRNDKIRSLS